MTRRPWLGLLIVLLALANGAFSHAARRSDAVGQIDHDDDGVAPCMTVAQPELPMRVDRVSEPPAPIASAVVTRLVLVVAPKTSPPPAS